MKQEIKEVTEMGFSNNKPIKTKGRITNYATKDKTPRCYETHPMGQKSRNIGKGAKNENLRAKM